MIRSCSLNWNCGKSVASSKQFFRIFSIFELGGATLNDWSRGEQWVLFPLGLNNVPLGAGSPRGTFRVSGKQNTLFLLRPVIKCLFFLLAFYLNWQTVQSTGGGGADIFSRETSQVILVPSQLFKTFTISLISSLFFYRNFYLVSLSVVQRPTRLIN